MDHSVSPSATVCVRAEDDEEDADPPLRRSVVAVDEDDARSVLARPDPLSVDEARRADDPSADPLRRSVVTVRSAAPDPVRRSADADDEEVDDDGDDDDARSPLFRVDPLSAGAARRSAAVTSPVRRSVAAPPPDALDPPRRSDDAVPARSLDVGEAPRALAEDDASDSPAGSGSPRTRGRLPRAGSLRATRGCGRAFSTRAASAYRRRLVPARRSSVLADRFSARICSGDSPANWASPVSESPSRTRYVPKPPRWRNSEAAYACCSARPCPTGTHTQ